LVSEPVVPRCPGCHQRILWRSAAGWKIRTNIIVFKSDGAVIKCRKCKADIPLDAYLGEALRKSLDQPPRRLLVRKGVDSADSAQ
jgi:hypothetical protein